VPQGSPYGALVSNTLIQDVMNSLDCCFLDHTLNVDNLRIFKVFITSRLILGGIPILHRQQKIKFFPDKIRYLITNKNGFSNFF
jgi:hypothetical protein